MVTGIEIAIAIGTPALGALGYYVKSSITEYIGKFRTEITEMVNTTSTDIKNTIHLDLVAKLAPVKQKQDDHTKDIDRLKDRSEKHSIDIKALETNVSNLIKSNEKLMEKLDRFFENNSR